jgi:single-strand DNA-binding protein
MANLNKVMLIGRLTHDPEVRTFANGGKVAKIRFAVNNRKKNQQTGEWEHDPVYLDIDAFNRETRKLADLVEQYLHRGDQAYIEGNLVLDQWVDKDGQKRSKLKVVLQDVQFLEPKAASPEGGGMRAAAPARTPARSGAPSSGGEEFDEPDNTSHGGQEEEIPF